jgi:hypothetical protein
MSYLKQLTKANSNIFWTYIAMILSVSVILDQFDYALGTYGEGMPPTWGLLYFSHIRFYQFLSFLAASLIISIAVIYQPRESSGSFIKYIPFILLVVLILDILIFFIINTVSMTSYNIDTINALLMWSLTIITCITLVFNLSKSQISEKALRFSLLVLTIVILVMGIELVNTLAMFFIAPNSVRETWAGYSLIFPLPVAYFKQFLFVVSYARLFIGIACVAIFGVIGIFSYVQGLIVIFKNRKQKELR